MYVVCEWLEFCVEMSHVRQVSILYRNLTSAELKLSLDARAALGKLM